jgi:hypothetical protein
VKAIAAGADAVGLSAKMTNSLECSAQDLCASQNRGRKEYCDEARVQEIVARARAATRASVTMGSDR